MTMMIPQRWLCFLLILNFASAQERILAPAPAPPECDAGAALPKVQEATNEMAAAGSDCGKLEKAHKKLKSALEDNNCAEEASMKPSMKALEDAMDSAGCDTSGAQRHFVASSAVVLAALALGMANHGLFQ